MRDQIVDWVAVPMVALSATSVISPKWSRRLSYVHIILIISLLSVYSQMRPSFVRNFSSPMLDKLDGRSVTFMDRGMKYLFYSPNAKAKRRILVCGGSRCCVRRMLREAYVAPFHKDCEILCFQLRGSEDSSPEFHLSSESIFVDTATAFTYASNTDLPVHIIGFSMGAFGAMQLCSRLQTDAKSIIIVGAFFDCRSMSMRLKIPCIALGFSNAPYVSKVNVPIMVVHSVDDDDVSIEEAEKIIEIRKYNNLPYDAMNVRGRHKQYELTSDDCVRLRKFLHI